MTVYIALLRAINVSGKRKVPMSDLRELVEALGHTDVRTYIQSGNVVFNATAGSPARIRSAMEQQIETAFGFGVTVLLRSPAELEAAMRRNPFGDSAYVTFLDEPPTAGSIAAIDPAAFAPDEFAVHGREVFVHCPNGYGRTKINNTFFERAFATKATTRNWRTLSTLYEWATA